MNAHTLRARLRAAAWPDACAHHPGVVMDGPLGPVRSTPDGPVWGGPRAATMVYGPDGTSGRGQRGGRTRRSAQHGAWLTLRADVRGWMVRDFRPHPVTSGRALRVHPGRAAQWLRWERDGAGATTLRQRALRRVMELHDAALDLDLLGNGRDDTTVRDALEAWYPALMPGTRAFEAASGWHVHLALLTLAPQLPAGSGPGALHAALDRVLPALLPTRWHTERLVLGPRDLEDWLARVDQLHPR